MIKHLRCFLIFSFFTNAVFAQPQKVIGDCTIVYSVISPADESGKMTGTLYVRGRQSRYDMQSNDFLQSVIYDDNTQGAVILRELQSDKYMKTLNAAQWKEENEKYAGIKFTPSNETKNILGYTCKKLKAILKDGRTFSIFYTPSLSVCCNKNPYEFKDVPGIVLEYETEAGQKAIVTFSATSINFSPVPHAKFEIGTQGYRKL